MDLPALVAVLAMAVALAGSLLVVRRRARERDAEAEAAAAAIRRAEAAEVALRHGAAVDPQLLDQLPVGCAHLDGEGHIDQANVAAHLLLEVAPGRLLGRTVMEAFVDARVDALVSAAREGGAAGGEVSIGVSEPRALLVRARRSGDDGTWLVLEDVTELRRLQQIRAEFVDNLSHELRTPLSTVSLLAETLARDAARADVPQRMRDRIAKVEVETGHLVQMVSELLDLARIEGGGTPVLVDDVDLGELARASVERLRLFADRQGVSLGVEVDGELPAVRGDESRLGQVFVNLVHNAVKFSPGGGDVTVRVERDGDEVVVAVEDHGIGIPRDDQPRIFERFYKVDRARVRGGGTGLGLSIARHVVRGHGGRIWVESEEGRGSTFSFAIPVAQPAPQPAPAAAGTGT